MDALNDRAEEFDTKQAEIEKIIMLKKRFLL